MLCPGGGCELAVINKFSVAWGKFKKLLPILTSKHITLELRGKFTRLVCVLPCYMAAKTELRQLLLCNDRSDPLDMWR